MIDSGRCTELNLVLFFTRGMSLRGWDVCGLLAREVALYRRLQEFGVQVTFVTYGDARDLTYSDQLPGITICCNRWNLPQKLYERLVSWLHRRSLDRADLIKTNQTNGADVAFRVARRFSKPLLARCGYMLSKNLRLALGGDAPQCRRALAIEAQVFPAADAVVVASEEMRQDILERFPVCRERLHLVPNYVDTERFRPFPGMREEGPIRLIFVGRLAPEKNLSVLIEAVRHLPVELHIVGQGPSRERLQSQAADLSRVRFHGVLPHQRLPELLAACDLFVFPSLYEGHPKTPIEAMACGLPVIGANVPGVRELIDHGRTGLLCDPNQDAVRQAIASLLDDRERRISMGMAAREAVVARFSLDRIVKMELEIYSRCGKRMAWGG